MDEIQKGKSVYILKTGKKLYKIGKSENLNERLEAYRTHLPTMFQVVRQYMAKNMDELEQGLHVVFQHKRIKGEWFKMGKDDLEICDNIARNYALENLQRTQPRKLQFGNNPQLQAYEANLKYLSDYSAIVHDLKLGLSINEIIEMHNGAISKTTIQTVRRLLKYQTPNSEFITQWAFIVDDLDAGMSVDEIVKKHEGKVSKIIVQTVRRILINHLY